MIDIIILLTLMIYGGQVAVTAMMIIIEGEPDKKTAIRLFLIPYYCVWLVIKTIRNKWDKLN